jgi:hypothetical protein
MTYIYNAGPLFSEADQKQRKLEGRLLMEAGKESEDYFVANPIDLPLDQNKPLSSQTIFAMDNSHIQKANVFFFELATGDTGTMVELGMAIQRLIMGGENRNLSDILRFAVSEKSCFWNRMSGRFQQFSDRQPYLSSDTKLSGF